MSFKRGDKVKHPQKPEWGVGRVLEDSADEKVRVFFVEAGERYLSLKHVPLERLIGKEANHPALDNLKLNKSKKPVKYRGLEYLKKKFLSIFPGGFSGTAYAETERNYKLEAHDLFNALLNKENFWQLLAAENYAEICKHALQISNKTNLIFPNEKMALRDGLKSPAGQKHFAQTLYALLFAEGDLAERFDDFIDCLLDLGAAKWTVATYYLFIANPDRFMFLKPTVTQQAAEVCAFELHYRTELNWTTYSKLLEFSQYLKRELADLNPKDMIDIQSFIWCIAQD